MNSDFTNIGNKTSILELDGGSIICELISIFYSESKNTHFDKIAHFHMNEIC